METEKVSGGHDPTCSQSFSSLPDIHELAREFPQSESDVSSTELAHELQYRPHRVNDKDSVGATPLHWACFLQKLSAVHLLLDSGADIDSATDDGWTPLHWACEIGQVGMVEVLLKRGAALNKMSLSGWTPLDCAVRNERLRVVELLLLIQCENSASANHRIGERAKDEKHGDVRLRWFWLLKLLYFIFFFYCCMSGQCLVSEGSHGRVGVGCEREFRRDRMAQQQRLCYQSISRLPCAYDSSASARCCENCGHQLGDGTLCSRYGG